jgi:hypothetical protein
VRKGERIAHIATLSRRLRRAIWTLAGLAVLGIAIVLLLGYGEAWIMFGEVKLKTADLSAGAATVLAVCWMPAAIMIGWLLCLAHRLLALYERGVIFGSENARIIGTSGRLIVALAVFDTVMPPIASWALTQVGIPISTWSMEPRFGLFFIGIGIVVVGHVMSLGAEMAEDQSLTI